MKNDAPELLEPSWNALLLVCKACGKRGSGPRKGLKAKEVVHELRSTFRGAHPKPRVLLTGCMGLCPKKAIAVVWADGRAAPKALAVASLSHARGVAPLLRTPTAEGADANPAEPTD